MTVANSRGQSTNVTFNLNVLSSPTPVYGNSTPIAINQNSISVSTINAGSGAGPAKADLNGGIVKSDLSGNITKVIVTVEGLTHNFPSDLALLLVGPQGQSVVLMSSAGGGIPVSDLTMTFDESATNVPSPSGPLTSGVFAPSDYTALDSFFAPAPAGPYSKTLNVFNGTNPKGVWSLYVQDNSAPDTGEISGGWVLNIATTEPQISSIAAQSTLENTALAVPFTVSSPATSASNLTVTAVSSGDSPAGLVAPSGLMVTGAGTNRTLLITPTTNLPSALTNGNGTDVITVFVTDGTITNSTSFAFTVVYAEQPPQIQGLSNQSTPANDPLAVNFSVVDMQVGIGTLTVTATGSDPTLGTVTVTGSGASQRLTFTPNGTLGTNIITVIATDGTVSATNSFAITVTAPAYTPIALAPLPDVTGTAVTTPNNGAGLLLQVTSQTALSNLVFSATTSNSNLVSAMYFGPASGTEAIDIVLVPDQVGVAPITVTVSDGITTATQRFNLFVVAPSAPTLAPIADQSTRKNVPVTVPLVVTDSATAVSNLTFTADISNTNLVSGVNIINSGSSVTATLNLVSNAYGAAAITIKVSDGITTVWQDFALLVTPTPPTLAPIGSQTALASVNPQITLSVFSPDTALSNLTFTGSSTSSSLVSGVSFATVGTNVVATVNLVSNQTGTATVTISVNDGYASSSQQFSLNVVAPFGPSLTATKVGNVLKITFTGTPRTKYILLNSTDLVNWHQVSSITTGPTGAVEFDENILSAGGGEFYRAQEK